MKGVHLRIAPFLFLIHDRTMQSPFGPQKPGFTLSPWPHHKLLQTLNIFRLF